MKYSIIKSICILLILCAYSCNKINGPVEGNGPTTRNYKLDNYSVSSLCVSSNNLFAGTTGEGVFLSTNNGNSWTAVNTGLTNTNIYGLVSIVTNLFAGSFQSPGDSTGGIFLSTNNGIIWKNTINTGLTNYRIDVLLANGVNLYVGTNSGVFRSTDQGTSWVDISSGTSLDSSAVISLATDGSDLIAGSNGNGLMRLSL
jgi:ligand-binding sensor domain-containing protein